MEQLKIELKWAFIFSGMTLVWMMLEKLVGLHDQYIAYHYSLTNLFAIPAIWVMVLALLAKKKQYYAGEMSYKQGLISGSILSVFIAIMSPVTQWVTSYIITPEYFPNVIEYALETGYHQTREEAEANFNYANYAMMGTIVALVNGVITTALAMIFIRSKTKPQTAESVIEPS